MEEIRFFNRHSGRFETEQVYGEAFLRWAYGNPLGKLALSTVIKRPFFSSWYGHRMDQPASAHRIAPFIEQYGVEAAEFIEPDNGFQSFNEFFYRKLEPHARPIEPDASGIVFPADGRHLGFQRASEIEGVFVKGQRFDLPRLLGDDTLAGRYRDGSLVLSRLCPVDYHRFHFPADGIPGETRTIDGPLFSVSPIALRRNLAYLWTNRRTRTELKTEAFGTILLLEIGATCVGRIEQTYRPGLPTTKGAEKGYFGFGGSSTITIFEPGRVVLAEDLVHHSSQLTELYARMGSLMAHLA